MTTKVCLITGAARGIGYGIAEGFAQTGYHVVIADLDLAQAEAAAAELTKQYGLQAIGVVMNVTDEAQVQAGFAEAIKHFGQLDCLVSNAGIQTIAPITEFALDAWEKLMAVHVRGSFLTAQAAMRQMQQQKTGGSIVFIGSIHSAEASLNKAAYVTAKHGLLGFMRAVAKEGAPYNIRANLVSPGFVKTPLVEKQIPEQAKTLGISEEEVVKKIMLGQTVDGEFTTVDDVVRSVLFFAEFPTKALTGQSLLVTHGWHME